MFCEKFANPHKQLIPALETLLINMKQNVPHEVTNKAEICGNNDVHPNW